jgi:hypothetical protein
MNIEPLKAQFLDGDDVVLRFTDPTPTTRKDADTLREYRWAVLRWDGGQWQRVRHGRLTFRGDTQVRYVRTRRLRGTGTYSVRVWRAGDLAGTGFPERYENSLVDTDIVIAQRPIARVELTKQRAAAVVQERETCATFEGFEAYVAANATIHPRSGVFGTAGYDELKRLAAEYASQCECDRLEDLMPPGYEQNRKDAEPTLPPDVKGQSESLLPCVELIWNYWLEEGRLVQTLNHILARFQNRRVAPRVDPLDRFDISPLLPIRNILWGFAEDETSRLTVRRRAAEYEYEYGLSLIGRAVPPARVLVERRSGFLRAFHTILHQAHVFFKEYDDLTVSADAFPLYQSLRECHLILAQGSHNQYGEMAVAARAEMLLMQHILAQPPMREFLGGRPMTPYPEAWMDRVDTMKAIQGWVDTSILHFHDLATIGERLVLTIRLGNWAHVGAGAAQAETWTIAFRPMIQKYVAAYRAVTGVDLAQRMDATMPSELIARRLTGSRRRA